MDTEKLDILIQLYKLLAFLSLSTGLWEGWTTWSDELLKGHWKGWTTWSGRYSEASVYHILICIQKWFFLVCGCGWDIFAAPYCIHKLKSIMSSNQIIC